MRTLIARTVLFATVVTLAACTADGADNLMAPSVPNHVKNANKDSDTKAKDIHGSLEAVETGTPTPGSPIVVRHLVGSGHASHLGRFTVVGDLTLNLATASGTGTAVYTAANGDMLTATATGQAVVGGGFATVTETVTVTGGTGRFEGATGTLTVVRRIEQATGVSTGTIDGTILLPK